MSKIYCPYCDKVLDSSSYETKDGSNYHTSCGNMCITLYEAGDQLPPHSIGNVGPKGVEGCPGLGPRLNSYDDDRS